MSAHDWIAVTCLVFIVAMGPIIWYGTVQDLKHMRADFKRLRDDIRGKQ